MPALITSLIDRQDNSEIVRDQIGAILLVKTAGQQALAVSAGKDPALWKLRIFSERSNAWDQFQDTPDAENPNQQFDSSPIVNVSFDSESFDMSTGNTVSRQKATGTFNVDCYALGVSGTDGGTGHIAGDELAAREAHRAARLARSILMAGVYTYLGMRGVVWRRWPQSVTIFKPLSDGRTVQHVVGARLALQVEFNEFSPQVEGVPLALLSLQVLRKETGQLLLRTDYPE